MGMFGNLLGSSKKADSYADEIASNFTKAFWGNSGVAKMNDMSEELITVAQMYWDRGDFESYKKVLSAAEETSYMYQGDKYPHKLVEDIIRDSH